MFPLRRASCIIKVPAGSGAKSAPSLGDQNSADDGQERDDRTEAGAGVLRAAHATDVVRLVAAVVGVDGQLCVVEDRVPTVGVGAVGAALLADEVVGLVTVGVLVQHRDERVLTAGYLVDLDRHVLVGTGAEVDARPAALSRTSPSSRAA